MKAEYRFDLPCERFILPVILYNPKEPTKEVKANALLDTGCQLMIVDESLIKKLGIEINPESTCSVSLADETTKLHSSGSAKYGLKMGTDFDIELESDVFDGTKEDVIIGLKFPGAMEKFSIVKTDKEYIITFEVKEDEE